MRLEYEYCCRRSFFMGKQYLFAKTRKIRVWRSFVLFQNNELFPVVCVLSDFFVIFGDLFSYISRILVHNVYTTEKK